jgi:hypothetical protein
VGHALSLVADNLLGAGKQEIAVALEGALLALGLVAQQDAVPVDSGVFTLYPVIGDLVGQLAGLGFVGMVIWAIIAKVRAKRKIAALPAPAQS